MAKETYRLEYDLGQHIISTVVYNTVARPGFHVTEHELGRRTNTYLRRNGQFRSNHAVQERREEVTRWFTDIRYDRYSWIPWVHLYRWDRDQWQHGWWKFNDGYVSWAITGSPTGIPPAGQLGTIEIGRIDPAILRGDLDQDSGVYENGILEDGYGFKAVLYIIPRGSDREPHNEIGTMAGFAGHSIQHTRKEPGGGVPNEVLRSVDWYAAGEGVTYIVLDEAAISVTRPAYPGEGTHRINHLHTTGNVSLAASGRTTTSGFNLSRERRSESYQFTASGQRVFLAEGRDNTKQTKDTTPRIVDFRWTVPDEALVADTSTPLKVHWQNAKRDRNGSFGSITRALSYKNSRQVYELPSADGRIIINAITGELNLENFITLRVNGDDPVTLSLIHI